MKAVVYSFSRRGAELSKYVRDFLRNAGYEADALTMAKYAAETGLDAADDYKADCGRAFGQCQAIVFVGAAGIAVRTIAPYIKSKLTDPAVLSIDEWGNFVIPLVAGHIGGANELARYLAEALGGVACVTTATDVNGLFAVDEWAARNNMVITSLKAAKQFAAALVNGERAGVYSDFVITGALPALMEQVSAEDAARFKTGVAVTLDSTMQPFAATTLLLPRIVHLGIGCRRNTPLENIEALVLPELQRLHLDLRSIAAIASVDLKKDEQGLLEFAQKLHVPAHFYSAAELNVVEGDFTPSAFVKSVVGVSNVCERSAVLDSNGGRLLLRKTSLNGVTLAVAVENITLDFTKTGLKTE